MKVAVLPFPVRVIIELRMGFGMGIDAAEQHDHATISGDLISSFNWAKILSATGLATSLRSDSGTRAT